MGPGLSIKMSDHNERACPNCGSYLHYTCFPPELGQIQPPITFDPADISTADANMIREVIREWEVGTLTISEFHLHLARLPEVPMSDQSLKQAVDDCRESLASGSGFLILCGAFRSPEAAEAAKLNYRRDAWTHRRFAEMRELLREAQKRTKDGAFYDRIGAALARLKDGPPTKEPDLDDERS